MGDMVFLVIQLAVAVLFIASMWRVFDKAGQPGWACLVPIYNAYVMLKVAGKPGWWLLLMLIPVVNIVIFILVYLAIAANFGKGAGYAIGMLLLPFIFWPMLAFGDAEYKLM